MSARPAPLDGVNVIDFSELLPGPFLTWCLAELGADVLKIERPPQGDPARYFAPGLFDVFSTGKRLRTLDMKDDAQRREAIDLIRASDVLIEGYRPGVMQRLGLGWEAMKEVNPGLIYVSLSGYGAEGPDALLPGHDINYLATAGVLAVSGRDIDGAPEHGFGLPFSDLSASLYALSAVQAALRQRDADGQGAYLDVAMTDCVVHMMACRTSVLDPNSLTDPRAQRRQILERPGYGVFETSDGQYLSIGILEEKFWTRMVEVLGWTHIDPAWQTHAGRKPATQQINQRLAETIRLESLDNWCQRFRDADVPFAPVISPGNLASHPHHLSRGLFEEGSSVPRFPIRW